jgi:hypothetical protein
MPPSEIAGSTSACAGADVSAAGVWLTVAFGAKRTLSQIYETRPNQQHNLAPEGDRGGGAMKVKTFTGTHRFAVDRQVNDWLAKSNVAVRKIDVAFKQRLGCRCR